LYKDIPKFRRDKEGRSDDGCAFFINSRTAEESTVHPTALSIFPLSRDNLPIALVKESPSTLQYIISKLWESLE
jgi:hypothetical protein